MAADNFLGLQFPKAVQIGFHEGEAVDVMERRAAVGGRPDDVAVACRVGPVSHRDDYRLALVRNGASP